MFLLIDCIADFGKINLKNLSKLKNLKINGDEFSRASGLSRPESLRLKIHDEITHKAIKPIAQKYLKDGEKIKYNAATRKLDFLPLANGLNLKSRKSLNYKDNYNGNLERLADKIEGQGRGKGGDPLDGLGRAFRKKNLTKPEQIATHMQDSSIVADLINTKRKPTQKDVSDLIKEVNPSGRRNSRQLKKVKGQKPELNSQQKRWELEDRARNRKYGEKYDLDYAIGN